MKNTIELLASVLIMPGAKAVDVGQVAGETGRSLWYCLSGFADRELLYICSVRFVTSSHATNW
ncbi:hypothetical protein [Methylomonas sp. ZR1]|uniref:hypothetical protein n=1 Tax=unclassified Methylomonas TaxID=2608980 RepID=UPI001490D18D|nr:hypothetical protein [Methylomonas sp. ZR1]NOV29549.1 hypothetical protein [Methylomonas sp. ZR1]